MTKQGTARIGRLDDREIMVTESDPAMRKHPGSWPEPDWRSDVAKSSPCPKCGSRSVAHIVSDIDEYDECRSCWHVWNWDFTEEAE